MNSPTQITNEEAVIAFLLPKASLTNDPKNAPPRVPRERRPTIKPDLMFENDLTPSGSEGLASANLSMKLRG